ncbi:MAG: sigma-70 family RNA polymerase sigma factor [Armatimonadota bacterium]|nr:sigma-70 family RNA polymerase sigma factor [bacterium]
MEQLSNAELMELVRNSDFVAFDELYNRYREDVFKFLYSLTWDRDVAEDYVQEVFLRLYTARNRYTPTAKFSTYLFQIAKNYYLYQRRGQKAQTKDLSLSYKDCSGFCPFENIRANERVEPEVQLMEEYRRLNIRRAIGMLPEGQKLVFVMSHIRDMKYAEIAEILQIPEGTVKSRMFAAVNKLQSLLKERYK